MTISIYQTPAETLYSGPFWDLLHQVSHHSPESTIVIVSSFKLKEQIEEQLATKKPENGLLPTCLTLDEFIQHGLGIPLKDQPIIDQTLFEKALFATQKKSLKLSQYDLTPGFKDRLLDTILKTTTYPFSPSDLPRHPWMETLQQLKNDFQTTCKTHHITRKPEAYQDIAKSPILKESLTGKGCFLIGFWQCPDYQKPLLETLLTQTDASSILLPYVPENPHYQGIEDFRKFLCTLSEAREIPSPTQPGRFAEPRYIQTETIQEELHWVCQDILKKKTEHPQLNWKDFTILSANMTSYAPDLNRLLTAYNIPSQTPLPHPVYQLPLYRFWNSLFDWIDTPDTPHFIRLLSSTVLTEMKNALNSESLPIDPDFFQRLEEHHGKRNRLEDLKNGCFLHIERLKKSSQTPESNLENTEKDIQRAKTQLLIIDRFIAIREAAKQPKTPEELIEWLGEIGQELCIDPDHPTTQFFREKSIELAHLFEFLFPEAPQKRFRKFLLKHLSKETLPLTPKDDDGIQIIGKFESFCYPHNHTYVLDCTAGTWPKTNPSHLFFSETDLKALNWPTQTTYKQWDELIFFTCLYQSESITLTAAASRGDSPTIPSPFIAKLRQDHFGVLPTAEGQLDPTLLTETNYLIALGSQARRAPQNIPDQSSIHPHWKHLQAQLNTPFTYTFDLQKTPPFTADVTNHIQSTKFSPTRLEAFQKCPTAYYFKYLLGEHPIESLEDDISQALWGQFLHTLLQKIGEKMHQHNRSFKIQSDHEAITEIAFKEAEEALSAHTHHGFFWEQKRPFLLGTAEKQGLLSAWLHCEFEDTTPLVPIQFEETLYTQLADPELGTIHLKGTIDVVLGSPNDNWLAVQDYKTGKVPPKAVDLGTFYHLQLPIYQWLLGEKAPKKTVAGSFVVKLNAAHEVEKKCLSTTKEAKENLFDFGKKRPLVLPDTYITDLKSHLMNLIQLMKTAHFEPHSPAPLDQFQNKRKESCRYCPYWHTCHYEKRFQK